jgi:hypothetical protein
MQTLRSITLSTGLLAAALVVASGPSWAQKTVKQCDAEWQANKAAIQASGKTKKDYVANCRQGSSAAASTEPRTAAKTTAKPSRPNAKTSPGSAATATSGSHKTVKECNTEWQANKASIQASGQTKKQYVAGCRAGTGSAAAQPPRRSARSAPVNSQPAAPSPAPTAQPAPSTREQKTGSAARERTARAPADGTGQAAAAQYSSVLAAKARCPADTVVWVNTDTKIYHYGGSARYGKTKDGAYMCEKDTAAAGFRPAKNEKHP